MSHLPAPPLRDEKKGEPGVNFPTEDMASTRDRKDAPAAYDQRQPSVTSTLMTPHHDDDQRRNPLTDRSSGVGPMHGIEP